MIDISYLYLFFILLTLTPLIYISKYYRLNIIKRSLFVIGRMFIQLSLVGIYLQYLFKLDNALVNFIYLIIMIIAASGSIVNNINIKYRYGLPVIFTALIIPTLLLLGFFNGFILNLDNIFNPKYLIPISGMLLGNSLSAIIIALNNFLNIFKDNEKTYLFHISLGANKFEALWPYIKGSLSNVISPVLASLATMGIVTLPGMMTGQILGGALPITAIKYQIAIMLLIFAIKVYASLISLILVGKFYFDDYSMPKKQIF